MTSVLLRLFGPSQAMSVENVLQNTEIKVAVGVIQNPPEIQSLEDLKNLVGQNDITKIEMDDDKRIITLIHQTIEVNHAYIDKAEIAWKSTEKKFGNVALTSFFVSLITFGAAGYFSIKEGKNLKAAAACVVGVVAWIFARVTNRASKLAQSEATKVGQIINDMIETRTLIAENGIMSFDASVFVPEVPKLFTPQEQDLLLTDWISKLKANPPTKPEEFIQLGKKLLALRDFHGEKYEAVMHQYFEVIAKLPEQISQRFKSSYDFFNELFGKFHDSESNDFFILLLQRFRRNNEPPVATEELHHLEIGKMWVKQLDKLVDKPESVQFESNEYIQTILRSHFKFIISSIFEADRAPIGYVDWLRRKLENLPKDTINKGFLLSCLPKKAN